MHPQNWKNAFENYPDDDDPDNGDDLEEDDEDDFEPVRKSRARLVRRWRRQTYTETGAFFPQDTLG